MRGIAVFGLVAAALLGLTPVEAADDLVTAYEPAGMARVLQDAGYTLTLGDDDYGDPSITIKLGDYDATIYFYGCDEETHDRCDSIQLRAGMDRQNPMPLTLVNTLTQKYRFAALNLDDEGDPWINFDIVLGSGIPKDVFLLAVKNYSDGLPVLADAVFAEERGKN
jgi:hypothetical protein